MSVGVEIAVGERLKFGEFELAPIARTLWRHGEEIRLGSRALDILIALTSRPGQIVSKDDLTQMVWRGALVDDTALRVGISAVRKALGNGGDRYITTVPGRGYCFVLDVETTEEKFTPECTNIRQLKPQRLPAQIARIFGRDDLIIALVAETTRHRLLSVVGTGGIGKTTVAVAVADRLRSAFDAVAFVDLSTIENETQVSAAVATSLGLVLRSQENRIEEIAIAVEGRRVLILLDNCEHVIELAAAFCETLLGRAQGITILATSRERLRAAGEWVHHLSPLDTPTGQFASSAEKVRGYSAAELFEERAAYALGGYEINDTDAPYVAEICRRLDGIALAIELAAGRLVGLGVQGLANSLEDCFSVLTHGRRTALLRHQTLRATLDWSYRLLSREDQTALISLSVFSGSFTFEDAAFVIGPMEYISGVRDLITNLIEKSLVVTRCVDGKLRYHLLDTTRAYSQGKLEESGEASIQRRRHAQRFLHICQTFVADEECDSIRQTTSDIRAALDWALVRGGDLSLGIDLAAAATPVFLRLSLLREYRRYLDIAISHISVGAGSIPICDGTLRSEVTLRAAVAQEDYLTEGWELVAEKQLLRALDIAREIGDKPQEFKILWSLYGQAGNVGRYAEALLYAQSFEVAARGSNDPTAAFRANRMLGRALSDVGQHGRALKHVQQALPSDGTAIPRVALLAYEIDHWIAARAILSRTLWLRGYPDDAKAEADQCIADAIQVGHEQSTCWAIIYNICPVAIWRGDFDHAEALLSLILERPQRVFEHYYEWGVLYRQCLDRMMTATGQMEAVCRSNLKAKSSAQVDLLATFDGTIAPQDTFARAQANENVWCAPELLRARACRLISEGSSADHAEAEDLLLSSLKLAQRQEAKGWELRTATTLASLYLQSGRIGETRDALEPILAQFKQGHDTRDFQKAVEVLSVLP